jgi:hypothetical protein
LTNNYHGNCNILSRALPTQQFTFCPDIILLGTTLPRLGLSTMDTNAPGEPFLRTAADADADRQEAGHNLVALRWKEWPNEAGVSRENTPPPSPDSTSCVESLAVCVHHICVHVIVH